MKNGEFIKTIWRLQFAGRWYDKAPKFKDNSASHSFRVALYSLVGAHLENERFGGQLDVEKIVCRAVFHDLNETVTTSINHFTKKNAEIKDIIKSFENKTSEQITNLLSHSLQPHFYDFLVCAEDDTPEGRFVDAMDTFDSYMFCFRESETSSSLFFRHKKDELRQRLHNYQNQTIDFLLKELDDRTDLADFLFNVLNLQNVERWAGKMSTIEDNDAMHTFRVSALGLWCAYIEKVKYGKNINILEFVGKCLCHDLVESLTGDVLGPIKHSSPENSEAFERYERSMNEFMVQLLPPEIRSLFVCYMVNAKDDSYEGELVDVADKLDALIKSLLELKRNREEYVDSYQAQLRNIQEKKQNPSVVYFLAYPIHDLHHSNIIYTRENNRLNP